MLKFIATAVVATGLTAGLNATAQASGCGHTTMAAPAQAAAPRAYQSYSYEPSAPVYRSQRAYRAYASPGSFRDAGAKARGQF